MKLPLPRTLHARLIFSHLLVALASVILMSAFAGRFIFSSARSQFEHHFEDLAFAASNDLEQPLHNLLIGEGSDGNVKAVLSRILVDDPGVIYTIFLPDGEPLISNSSKPTSRVDSASAPEVFQAMQTKLGEGERVRMNANGKQIHYLAIQINHESQIYGVLRLEVPVQPALASAWRSLAFLLLTDLVVVLGVGVVGSLFARNLARPIEGLTHTAEHLSRGNLSARAVIPDTPQELNRLAESFNAMADRLQTHVNELRSFVANASHELRTPLTSVKLRVEALRNGALDEPIVTDRFLAEIESEVDRLSHMVNDMLDLSRIEAGLASSQRSVLDLSTIVGEVSETFRARAERAGVNLECHIDPKIPPILGNEDQLRRMLYNLVDNAIKYTSRDGRVDLYLQNSGRGNVVRLMVKDTGFGISAVDLPHVFERFYRVEATRPRFGPPHGSGLGLPIARSIVETHGGKIGVVSEVGQGSTFWVELPAYE